MSLLNRPPREQRKAAILDVDGTLVDSNDAHADAWVDAFAEANVRVDREQVRRAIGMGGDKLMPRVSGIAEESSEGSRISARRAEIFRSRYLPHIQPFPRVRELVQRLIDDGFTVVVASSAKEDELKGLLERAGVADLIHARTSSDDADESKPDPDIVNAALQRAAVPRTAAVMLGDTPYDVRAALAAGIAVVGVTSGGWQQADLQGAVAVYASATDLYERYDQSAFGRLRTQDTERTPTPSIDLRAVAMIVAGVTGVALIILTMRALARKTAMRGEDAPVREPRAGLSARDRQRLRYLIEHTS